MVFGQFGSQRIKLHVQKKMKIILCGFSFIQVNLHVNDLFTDLSDGKVLIKLLETISGEKIGSPGNNL